MWAQYSLFMKLCETPVKPDGDTSHANYTITLLFETFTDEKQTFPLLIVASQRQYSIFFFSLFIHLKVTICIANVVWCKKQQHQLETITNDHCKSRISQIYSFNVFSGAILILSSSSYFSYAIIISFFAISLSFAPSFSFCVLFCAHFLGSCLIIRVVADKEEIDTQKRRVKRSCLCVCVELNYTQLHKSNITNSFNWTNFKHAKFVETNWMNTIFSMNAHQIC